MSEMLVVAQVAQIERLTAEIVGIAEQTTQIVVMSAVRIGGLLKQAKELVAPGEWGTYVETQCRFSHRTANNFMRLHAEWQDNPNSQALANLGYTKAIRLLSIPEEDRQELLEQNDVQSMSTRELEQLIRERDAAREEAVAAQQEGESLQVQAVEAAARASKAEQTVKDLQAQLNALKSQKPTVPKDVRESIRAEASAQAQKEFEKKLQTLQDALDAATASAKASADEAAKAAAKLDAAEKGQKLADPEVAEFNFLFNSVQEQVNKMKGLRMKLVRKDASYSDKLSAALRSLAAFVEKAARDEQQ